MLLGTLQKGRKTQTKKMMLKKNDINRGVFRTQSNIYNGDFLQKQLTARSRFKTANLCDKLEHLLP